MMPNCCSRIRQWTIALAVGLLAATSELRAQEMPQPTAAPPLNLSNAITRQARLEGRVMWLDGTANLQRLSTREGVADVFARCEAANINTVVVDVKPLSGHVLYNSKVAPKLREWRGFTYPEGYDLLLLTMLEGKRRGIEVYASINVFSEAHKLVRSGPLYDRPETQAIVYDVQRTVTAPDGTSWDLAVGENRMPGEHQISSFDARNEDGFVLGPRDAAVIVQDEHVTSVIDGLVATGGRVVPPQEGHVLVGRGMGAQWLLEHAPVAARLTYTARPVLQPILEAPSELVGGFVNPANPQARAYALKIVEELADSYALDGIVFDRMRYASLRTDFSPLSREQFEAWLGQKVARFPEDIFEYPATPGQPVIRGPHFQQWLEWRAKTIRDWVDEARKLVDRKRPGMKLGAYVGSWYEDYYGVGVNWGATDFAPGYDWMSPNYAATGYADKLDWITTGCYYPVPTRELAREVQQPEEKTVQAAAELSVRAVNDATFVYAGLNLLDYPRDGNAFRKALETALAHSQGVMLFDLVYVDQYDWWEILRGAFPEPRRAPHDVPGLREAIRQTKRVLSMTPTQAD